MVYALRIVMLIDISRSCPGVYLADAMLYIMIVTTLSVFRIQPERDHKGNFIVPAVKYTTGAVRCDYLYRFHTYSV